VVDFGTPVLRPDDHGLVGDGVFEAIKVRDGVPFALTRHLRRLAASAGGLGIQFEADEVRAAIDSILSASSPMDPECWLRLTVTGGSAPMGSGGVGATPTIIAAVAPMARWSPTANVVVAPWTRNAGGPTAGLKTISYADNVIALRHAHQRGADEAIFANTDGRLCEGTGSNVVVAIGGRLLTPPLRSGCLAGVTRELLLEWLPELEEADLPLSALAKADEAFLTSTSRDVHPIASVDGALLPSVPGPLTTRAMEVFAARASKHHDP
jgi:branched-chain amino acid aminotransferase